MSDSSRVEWEVATALVSSSPREARPVFNSHSHLSHSPISFRHGWVAPQLLRM